MRAMVFDSQDSANLYVHQLIQDRTNSNDSSPTSKSFINSLKTFKVTKSILKAGHAMTMTTSCAICTNDFELDEKLVRLRCGHCFHRDCILLWLNEKSTCPMCRYQLPKQPLYKMEKMADGYKVVINRSSGKTTTIWVWTGTTSCNTSCGV